MKSSAAVLTLGITLLFALPASAAIDEEPSAILQPEEALHRAAQLRAEAAAHQVMERQATAMTGGSWRQRRWRRTMIQLCREYAASAIQTASAYERAAATASPSPTEPHDGLMPHASPSVTAAEYDARAAEYEAQAETLRADADRHLAMLRCDMTALETDVDPCRCGANAHHPRRIVLTGGPSGGKTRLLESIRESLCPHVGLLPEAASIVSRTHCASSRRGRRQRSTRRSPGRGAAIRIESSSTPQKRSTRRLPPLSPSFEPNCLPAASPTRLARMVRRASTVRM